MANNKCIYILLLLLANLSVVKQSYTQDSTILNREISLHISNGTIYEALIEISKQTSYNFAYNAELIDGSSKISVRYVQESVSEVLDQIFENRFEYFIINNQIVLVEKSENKNNQNTNDTANQTKKTYVEILGKVIDRNTYEPLEYASVSIYGKPMGTITNADGEFLLKVPDELLEDTLAITYLGYSDQIIPVNELSEYENLISLERIYYSIQEVVIRHIDPVSLIRSSLNSVNENYQSEPARFKSFYREIIKKEGQYSQVIEALLDIYKSPYNSIISNDQIKLYKMRKKVDNTLLDTVLFKVKAGLNTSLILDVIDNRINFLDPLYFMTYDYQFYDVVNLEGRSVYKIYFEPLYIIENESQFEGFLYIDINSFALIAANFAFHEESIDQLSNAFILKKSGKLKVRATAAEYYVGYKMLGDKYYLNQVRSSVKFKVRERRKLFSTDYEISIEMAVNDVDTTDVQKFQRREIINTHTIFTDEKHQYDETFWEKYNFIRPEQSLIKAIEELSKKETRTQNN